MNDRPGYSTLIGRIRENVRAYIRKQIELPKQEIGEIIQQNLKAVKWFGIAAGLAFMFLIAFVILLVAIVGGLLALLLPYPWALAVGALLVVLLLAAFAGFAGWRGYRSLDVRGPQRSIESFKETVTWAKARLLGRSES
jgi:predicted lysophospholipase L1 biosynthesis ABC-type transport system permease subunit